MQKGKRSKHHHRFFVNPEEIQGGFFITKDKDLINQIKNVFRLHGHNYNGDKEGDHILVLDGTGWEYDVELEEVASNNVDGSIGEKRFHEEEKTKMNLFCPNLKGDHLEMVLQKGTEIGVDSFYLVNYQNSIVKEISPNKLDRYRKIIKEASEQSMCAKIPNILELSNLREAIEDLQGQVCLVSDQESDKGILDFMPIIKKNNPINIFVGPEGDFSIEEKEEMEKAGFLFFNLGDNTLRSETACIVSAGIISQIVV